MKVLFLRQMIPLSWELILVNHGSLSKDRWIVSNPESNNNIWWGNINQPTSNKVFDEVVEKAITHFNTLDSVYLYDGYCGANIKTRRHKICA